MSLLPKQVRAFKDIRNRFEPEALLQKESLLSALLQSPAWPVNSLSDLHETLLFLEAHPHSPAFLKQVRLALKSCCRQILDALQKGNKVALRLFDQSGVRGTSVTATFSLELCSWLHHTYPKAIRFDSFGAEQDVLSAAIYALLPSALREHFQDGDAATVEEWLEQVAGEDPSVQLGFLLSLFENTKMDPAFRQQLFESLQLYITADLAFMPSRSNIRIQKNRTFVHHEPLIRKVDLRTLLHDPLGAPLLLRGTEAEKWIAAFRLQLLSLYRETDPGSWTDMKDLQLFDVGRGMEILLPSLDVDHRRPFDSYIGFMAFKNGLPYAYGGAWMLGRMARIGINIFSSFRGGESAWFFGQLMRTYFQLYRPDFFVAEPYQIGRDNPEGLATGAFWFYYRLGFRPESDELQQLAVRESEKMRGSNTYKTPLSTLKKLVSGEMLLLTNHDYALLKLKYDTLGISNAIRAYIYDRYKGDFQAAREAAVSMLKSIEGFDAGSEAALYRMAEGWGLALSAGGGIRKWNRNDIAALAELLNEKASGSDSRYAVLMSRHLPLQQFLRRLANQH
jgi:hypothetical protein